MDGRISRFVDTHPSRWRAAREVGSDRSKHTEERFEVKMSFVGLTFEVQIINGFIVSDGGNTHVAYSPMGLLSTARLHECLLESIII